jgi:branched-subunit amino acid aminotransferase/4-amino-4-deoxychorismate lyase
MLVWVNGRVVDARAARVSALDRGLLHGDGVYDTWRTYEGRPFALAAHLRRLARATRRLALPAPGAAGPWAERTRRLLAANRLRDGAVRLTITRGVAGVAPAPARGGRATVLLTVRPLPPALAATQARGVGAVLLPFPRDAGPGWGDLKLVGHASAVVGRMLALRRHAAEGLYVTADGHVGEGTTSNVFVVERGRLLTPPLDGTILAGVTRELVLRLARRAGLPVVETRLARARVERAAELFLTASTIEVLPVVRLGGRRVGDGRPGPVTRRLQEDYRRLVRRTRGRA